MKVVEKIKIQHVYSVRFILNSHRLWDNVEDCDGAREDAISNMEAPCILDL